MPSASGTVEAPPSYRTRGIGSMIAAAGASWRDYVLRFARGKKARQKPG